MLFLANIWEQLIEKDQLIAYVAIVGGISVAIVAIVFSSLKAIVVGRAREATKREIAAYVAEGSLDPDKAIALLEAGKPPSECA